MFNDYKEYFNEKKITLMGLGILGRGLGIAKFLIECNADLTITDLKTKKELKSSVFEIKKILARKKKKGKSKVKFKVKFVLGKHKLEDFKDKDLIIKSAGVPLDSPYIREAVRNRIPVEMDVSLFAKLAPKTKLIGVTGTRGKSMTTALVYEILKQNESFIKKNVYIGGNVRGVATLPLLKEIYKINQTKSREESLQELNRRLNTKSKNNQKFGDSILVCELDSWQLQGFGDSKLSPHISIFTSFLPDHMNYYKGSMKRYFDDKANIFKYQKKGDVLIIRPGVKKLIPKNIKSRLIEAKAKDAEKYSFKVPGVHQRENLACAVTVAQLFKIPESRISKAVKNFKGLEGRLEYLKTINGVKIYNDNNATTQEATIAGIEALSSIVKKAKEKKKIILIAGGSDKNLPLDDFENVANEYCRGVVLLNGTGSDKLKNLKNVVKVNTLRKAFEEALALAKSGDIILFSPAFASFGMFKNEYDRGDQFVKIVKKWKI